MRGGKVEEAWIKGTFGRAAALAALAEAARWGHRQTTGARLFITAVFPRIKRVCLFLGKGLSSQMGKLCRKKPGSGQKNIR